MKLAKKLQYLGTETAFSVSAAAAEWAAKGNKVYPFHLGDIDLATPANIAEAAQKAIVDGYTGYCQGAGIIELREAIAEDVGSKRKVRYNAENVSIQPGGKPVIGKFLQAVMNPGDEVLYPNPGYPIYESQIEYLGGVAMPYGYRESTEGFSLDLDAIISTSRVTSSRPIFIPIYVGRHGHRPTPLLAGPTHKAAPASSFAGRIPFQAMR